MGIKLSFFVANIRANPAKKRKKKTVLMGGKLVFLTSANTTAGETASL